MLGADVRALGGSLPFGAVWLGFGLAWLGLGLGLAFAIGLPVGRATVEPKASPVQRSVCIRVSGPPDMGVLARAARQRARLLRTFCQARPPRTPK